MSKSWGFLNRFMEEYMELQNSFFEDEVIDGFYVPAMIKRAWGAELKVISEIDRICRKYDIKYFADWGSLIGTVRHEGFIPWDDDVDICMKREDYKKFLEVAEKELPDDYKVFTYDRHPDFWLFLARVVAKPHISFEKEHLDKFYQFPYIVGVDIFILDYISADEEFERERIKKAKFVIEAIDAVCTQDVAVDVADRFITAIEELCFVKIPDKLKFYKLKNTKILNIEKCKYDLRVFVYGLAEKIFAMVDESQAEFVGQMIPHYIYHDVKMPKFYYENIIRLPFENTTMPVSMVYDTMLKRKYGDYMRLVKNSGGHDYPFFESQQKSLDDIFAKENIVISNKFEYNSSEIEKIYLERKDNKNNSYKSLVSECYNELVNMQNNLALEEDSEKKVAILGNAQQLAIDMGTLIENCKGEGFVTVEYIQNYCEEIFRMYNSILENNYNSNYLNNVVKSLSQVKNSLDKELFERKEIVFIISHTNKWKYFETEYKRIQNDENCDVYVMIIPYYYKDFYGTFRDMQYETELFEKFAEKINLIKYDEYDFGLRYPEKIYIQNPYDAYNPVTSEHSFFYSSNIIKYTDKLVYISTFEMDDFSKNNYREYHNMKHYCTVPGVVYSDETIVYSDCIRERYIEKLTEFAGEETASIWQKKIISSECVYKKDIIDIPKKWKNISQNKKVVLYHIGIYGFIEHKEKMLDKIKNVLEIFYNNKDDIQLIWRPHKFTDDILKDYSLELYNKYMDIVSEYKKAEWGIFDFDEDEDLVVSVCDAYYGDATPIVRKFRNKNKPVMLQNIDFIIK